MTRRHAILIALLAAIVVSVALSKAAAEVFDPLNQKTFQDLIKNALEFATNKILAPLSTLMVLIAGFLYLTGGGSPEKIKTAHKVLIWALVGIGIVLLANGAQNIIRDILGAP